MPVLLRSETLISYRVIQLPFVGEELKYAPRELEVALKRIEHTTKDEAVELRGSVPLFFFLAVFARLYGSVSEITYRHKPSEPAYLVHSFLDETEFIRPSDVREIPLKWTASERSEMTEARSKRQDMDVKLDFGAMWKEAESAGEVHALKRFLAQVYACEPFGRTVSLTGQVPIFAAILALKWFLPFAKSISYDGISLKGQSSFIA